LVGKGEENGHFVFLVLRKKVKDTSPVKLCRDSIWKTAPMSKRVGRSGGGDGTRERNDWKVKEGRGPKDLIRGKRDGKGILGKKKKLTLWGGSR